MEKTNDWSRVLDSVVSKRPQRMGHVLRRLAIWYADTAAQAGMPGRTFPQQDSPNGSTSLGKSWPAGITATCCTAHEELQRCSSS